MSDRDKLKQELDKSLRNGRYADLFFEDVLNLWKVEGISPEVILREIRALEELEQSALILDNNEPIPVWFGASDSVGPDMYLNTDSSSTKTETQFTKKDSPLKGLWHKHYYIHQEDFLTENVKNAERKHKFLKGAPPIIQFMAKIAEGTVTGEWIIFKKEDGKNSYLCLALHNDGDEKIHARIEQGSSQA